LQDNVVVGQFISVLLPGGHVGGDPPVAHRGRVTSVDGCLVVQEGLGCWMLEEYSAEHGQLLAWDDWYVNHVLCLLEFLDTKQRKNKININVHYKVQHQSFGIF
jgi:hypothetical protein